MNLDRAASLLRKLVFRTTHALANMLPGQRIDAFGSGHNKIEEILVINLDRQPNRWRRMQRELGRLRASDGSPLTLLSRRLSAIDARDGRATAATADVDPMYRIGNQLYVQPDPQLSATFSADEPVRMTRQETAVARSHIEAWKSVAEGQRQFVLILEDDVWFKRGAASAITRGWHAAIKRCQGNGPNLLYLSYDDAGGTVDRTEACDVLFEPSRGLWFLSGYVLSIEGAKMLLRSMPVVGPVDMWINYRFRELRALALQAPAILQRLDGGSDNAYSILPYLARAGIVDAGSGMMAPASAKRSPIFAWTAGGESEVLPMALSMLGFRVRAFDGDEEAIGPAELTTLLESFDALIDAPLAPSALSTMVNRREAKFILEENAQELDRLVGSALFSKALVLGRNDSGSHGWTSICRFLGVAIPADDFPAGAPRRLRLFRDDRIVVARSLPNSPSGPSLPIDDSPWVLSPRNAWPMPVHRNEVLDRRRLPILDAPLKTRPTDLQSVVETFPGNLAVFAHDAVSYDETGAKISIRSAPGAIRPYKSGALASKRSFGHGRFEAEIKAAAGSGLVTGFFLHRSGPRQEIDIEISGNDPKRMLVNVFFNPGDEGSANAFGYRGSPCHVELGFDSTLDFHRYAIDWRPQGITWSVDGVIVHERVGWDPTPIPHLPMRLHANLWAPRSQTLAGPIEDTALPRAAVFRNVSVFDASGEVAPSRALHGAVMEDHTCAVSTCAHTRMS